MHKNQQHFDEVAKELEPDKDPRAVLEELGSHASRSRSTDRRLHAPPSTSLLDFIRAHHIVTIPSDVRPILEETPPFMRATTLPAWTRPGPSKRTPPTPTSTSRCPIPP